MDYEKTIPFSGDIKSVLEVARNAFKQNNRDCFSTACSVASVNPRNS